MLGRCALALLASAFASGCLYYDSRWGQATAEQRNVAQSLTPAGLETSKASTDVVRRSATIVACATARYSAETLDWQDRFDELVHQANSVLEPDLGLTLKNLGGRLWAPEHGESDLVAVIRDLPKCDAAEADFRVALVESTASVVTDFHILGRGEEYSPYLALRAANDPAELDALSRALPDLDRATREKLYGDRKRHKTLAVFLHELGHTLGAIHRTSKADIMSQSYSEAARGFDEVTLAVLRTGVAIRLDGTNRYGEARKWLETHPEAFFPSDRTLQIEFLRQLEERSARVVRRRSEDTPTPVASASAAPPLAVNPPAAFDTMDKADRQAFDYALRVEPNDPREAWRVAQPLFEGYPSVREVQELRCRLASERKFFPAVVEAHCARLQALGK